MKERPILFSSPMVRAILDGRKTQTRRVSGLDVINKEPGRYEFIGITSGPGVPHAAFRDLKTSAQVLVKCPYGAPGDRLWVRETWAPSKARELAMPRNLPHGSWLAYAADGEDKTNSRGKWRPSIHMPRWASRITLEVLSVRVERLHDISEVDAKAEGTTPEPCDHRFMKAGDVCPGPDYRLAFHQLWESINGAESWAANPWIWRVEFKRAQP